MTDSFASLGSMDELEWMTEAELRKLREKKEQEIEENTKQIRLNNVENFQPGAAHDIIQGYDLLQKDVPLLKNIKRLRA